VVRGLDPDRLAFLIRLSFAINCKNRAHDCSAELARFAVDCKLSVLRHVSEDTSWDTVECWVPQQLWSTISLSAVDYRPV